MKTFVFEPPPQKIDQNYVGLIVQLVQSQMTANLAPEGSKHQRNGWSRILKVLALVVSFSLLVLGALLLRNFHRKQRLSKHAQDSTSEHLSMAGSSGSTIALLQTTNTTITTTVEKCSMSFPSVNSGDAVRHMYSLNQFVFSPLHFIETNHSYVPPSWFENPRSCVTENASCALPHDSGTPNLTLGQHICDLDSCFPGAVDLLVQIHRTAFVSADHWFAQLYSTWFLFVGDSTAGQQYRSFLCVLNDHLTPLQQLDRNIRVEFSWEAYIYNDSMRNTTSEDTVLAYFHTRNLHPSGSQQRLVVVMAFGAWYQPHLAKRYQNDVMIFTYWWQQLRPVNATLVWRDALPQHFPTETGAYNASLQPPLTFGSYTCRPAKTSCAQEMFVMSTRRLVNPDSKVYTLPVHDWARDMHYGHNIRSGDCTHYCIAVMALWNTFLVRLVALIFNQ